MMRAALVTSDDLRVFLHTAKASSDRPGEESAAVSLARASWRKHFFPLTDGLLNRLLVGRSWRV